MFVNFGCLFYRILRNEALDCRVYAMCAGDVFLGQLVLDYKAAVKKAGTKNWLRMRQDR
jgi:hypothetical protein